MKGEEGLEIGLATLEKVADEERQYARNQEKYDDEHIRERRRKIVGQLAAEDGQDVAHGITPRRPWWLVWAARRGSRGRRRRAAPARPADRCSSSRGRWRGRRFRRQP